MITYKQIFDLAKEKGYQGIFNMLVNFLDREKAYLFELTLIKKWMKDQFKIQMFLDYTYYDGFHYGVKWVRANGDYGQIWKDNDGEDPDGWDTPEEAEINATFELLNKI